MSLVVSALYVYPLKSGHRRRVERIQLDANGPHSDRRWMLVTAGTDEFMTQRRFPVMALIIARPDREAVNFEIPGYGSLRVPRGGVDERQYRVWGRSVLGLSCGGEADQWFSEYLGKPCRLIYAPPAQQTRDDDMSVSYSDGYPLLITNEESLADLDSRLGEAVAMTRFRPNIVVSGAPAWSEDRWQTLTNEAGVRLKIEERCERCSVPTIDQDSGRRTGTEPIETLRSFRMSEDGRVFFGVNASIVETGEIHIGDTLTISQGG